jgi:hypothetical protein
MKTWLAHELPPPRYAPGQPVTAWAGDRWVSGQIVVAIRRAYAQPIVLYWLEVPGEWDWICVRDGAIRLSHALEAVYKEAS